MPVPWVAVAVAPASDWRSISPMFGMASPAASSSAVEGVEAYAGPAR